MTTTRTTADKLARLGVPHEARQICFDLPLSSTSISLRRQLMIWSLQGRHARDGKWDGLRPARIEVATGEQVQFGG
jgi:hypothetical protein